MLLEFKIRNFRSFYHETVLSMVASKQRDHNDFLISTTSPARRILPSAVIYGPNASGKTSLILGFAFLKYIVETGNIRKQKGNLFSLALELYPFIHEHKKFNEPIHCEISFLTEGMEFTYGISIESKLEKNYNEGSRKIVYEFLRINQKEVFTRNDQNITLAKDKKALRLYKDKTSAALLETLETQVNTNLEATDLFLSNAFKSAVNSEIANKALYWFKEKLIPFIDFDESQLEIKLSESNSKRYFGYRNAVMRAMISHADFGPQDIIFYVEGKDESNRNAQLRSMYKINGGKGLAIPSELMESKGTLKMLGFSFPFVDALKNGKVLVVDELDASLHPDLIAAIVAVFNNRQINTKGAQLIFNTHNPIYLNNNLFRRDQILFVSKNRNSYESELYSLADFKTYGENAVRNDEQLMKNYISGKYGAIPFVDFEAAIHEALRENCPREEE
ncbi:MAG: AAA family ATPase [Bacillota bacterium]